MRSEPMAVLKTMYANRGDRIVRDPELCDAELKDRCGECKREIAILVNTVRCGAAQELLGSTAPYPSIRARLIQKVQDEQGLTEEAASWGVDTWREALTGSAPEAASEPAPKAATKPAPQKARDLEFPNVLIWAIGSFVLYWGFGLFLMLVVGMVLQTTSHSTELVMSIYTFLMRVGMFTFFTRVSGLTGALAYFVSQRGKFSLWPSALGGGVAGAIAFVMITMGTDIPNGVLVGAIVLGALLGAALSKKTLKRVEVAKSLP
jgi:hypothetical protein